MLKAKVKILSNNLGGIFDKGQIFEVVLRDHRNGVKSTKEKGLFLFKDHLDMGIWSYPDHNVFEMIFEERKIPVTKMEKEIDEIETMGFRYE